MKTRLRIAKSIALAGLAIASLMANPSSHAANISEETAKAFNEYVAAREQHFLGDGAEPGRFLETDGPDQSDPAKQRRQLQQRQIPVVNQLSAKNPSVPGGLIHDWIATVFIPGASLRSTLQTMQNYDQDRIMYQPDVVKSKLISRTGDDFKVYLRLKRTYVITAVFDTEYDVRYSVVDSHRAYSRSISTRIAEVENAGEPDERVAAAGNDRGILWRLNSYWRFYEADGGTYIQCEAISLTRDIPAGLGWMVRPFVEKVPMESLRFTMEATRDAVAKSSH